MATEKTSLLHNNLVVPDKVKESMVVVTIPKQITDNDDDDDEMSSGLTRNELMAYANDPYWVSLRKTLMIVFWITLFAMFTSAIVIASVEHHEICAPKLKMLNMAGIQTPVEIINKLSTSTDKSNLTNSLAS